MTILKRIVRSNRQRSLTRGFTLVEVLVALTILAEIAAFTLPKIIYAQVNAQMNSVAKEDFATMAQALQLLSMDKGLTATTTSADLVPYLNSIVNDTSSSIDDAYGASGSQACTASSPCAKLANGSAIKVNTCTFGGTNPSVNMIEFFVDPDGKVTAGGGASTEGKSIRGFIYYSGRVVSWSTVASGSSSGCQGWFSYNDPPYFKW